MSTVQELERAIPQLSPQELADFRAWFEEYCEDRLELTAEVKAKLNQARQEIQDGLFRTRQPQ
jgi:ABC-type Zn uptake system ZnuABC Zn-binding protein ZnuA